MIVLGGEAEAAQVPGTESHEALAGLELEIDLVADVSLETVDLVGGIRGDAQPRISVRRRPAATEGARHEQQRAGGERKNPSTGPESFTRAATHDAHRPHPLLPDAGCPSTSGSEVSSTILKPSGFQRRTRGSFGGAV